jgi:hypothetical protein
MKDAVRWPWLILVRRELRNCGRVARILGASPGAVKVSVGIIAPPGMTIFSYEQAVGLLPRVREVTEQAYRKAEALAEGAPRAQEQLDALLQGWAREVAEMGAEVKGPWLVDFDNGSGYYCWHYPEERLEFFHTYEEGFRGRMRIQ